jgi:hypothetical protein
VPTDDTPAPRPTHRYRDVLRLAEAQARRLGHRHLGAEHLMLAVLQDGRSPPALALQKFVDLATVREEIERILTFEGEHPAPRHRHIGDETPRSDSVAVSLVRGDERQQAMIHWAWQAHHDPAERYRARLEWPGPVIEVAAGDVFDALVRIREQVEPHGWLVAVQGSRLDAYPTAMQREMAGGLAVYVVRLGEPVRLEDVVETFGEADPATLATVAGQRAHLEEWARSLGGGTPSER